MPVPAAMLDGRGETAERRAAYGLLARLMRDAREAGAIDDLVRGPFGQPILEGRPEVRVSIAHTDGVVAAAFARGRRVGIDVEAPAPFDRAAAALVLSPRELAAVTESVDPAAAFLRLWVRKEALGKALGLGLAPEVTAVEVDRDRVTPAGSLLAHGHLKREQIYVFGRFGPNTIYSGDFHLGDIAAPGGAVAALAVEDDSNR